MVKNVNTQTRVSSIKKVCINVGLQDYYYKFVYVKPFSFISFDNAVNMGTRLCAVDRFEEHN